MWRTEERFNSKWVKGGGVHIALNECCASDFTCTILSPMQSSPVICLYQLYNLDLLETVVRAVFAVPAGIPELAFIWLAWATDPKKHKVGLDGCGCCLYGYNTGAAITLVTRLKLTQELCAAATAQCQCRLTPTHSKECQEKMPCSSCSSSQGVLILIFWSLIFQ